MSARRIKGEGSVARFHNHPTCPPVGPDGERPDHKCQGPWRARVWVTTTSGKRTRKAVYGKTQAEVIAAVKKLNAQEDRHEVLESHTTVRAWFRTDAAELDPPQENFWTRYREEWKVNTRKGYRSKIDRYIIPFLGHHRLDKLTPGHVEDLFRDMRRRGLSDATQHQAYAILRRGLAIAMRHGLVFRNVCDLIDAPSVSTNTPRALTAEEARKVLRIAGDNPRFWLALLQGLRQGEVLGLRWYDIHLPNESGLCATCGAVHVDEDGTPTPFLVVRESVSREPGVGLVFDDPKSETSKDRIVPLVTPVVARLTVLRAKRLADGGTDNDLVFPNPRTGNAMDAKRDWTAWTVLLEMAGVPHTTLHAARRTTASLLEDAGVPDRVVAEILGHATVHMTHHYQKGNLRGKREAIRALESYLSQDPGEDVA